MPFVYAFEAKSIQGWIMAGGKLRDIAGASHLLDRLCAPDVPFPGDATGDPADGATDGVTGERSGKAVEADALAAVLRRLDDARELRLMRRAGGAITLVHAERAPLARLRALWRAELSVRAPGLGFVDALCAGDTVAAAVRAARGAMAATAIPAPSPIRPGPFAARDARTGAAATAFCRITQRWIDAGIAAKRATIKQHEKRGDDPLGAKFTPAGEKDLAWPYEMDGSETRDRAELEPGERADVFFPFAAVGENRTVGIVHADGNGLGRALTALDQAFTDRGIVGDEYAEAFRCFSEALARATRAAAQRAVHETLLGLCEPQAGRRVVPCRPVLLGGDDLTAIVRGDCARPFTRAFLVAFEEETARAFEELNTTEMFDGALPEEGFSAGAGIVYLGATQPFSQGLVLAESLAKGAKSAAKRWAEANGAALAPSLVCFQRVTAAAIPESRKDILRDLRIPDPDDDADTDSGTDPDTDPDTGPGAGPDAGPDPAVLLAAGPYHVNGAGAGDFPTLSALEALVASLRSPGLGKGAVRRLSGAFFEGSWQKPWDRIITVTRKADAEAARRFEAALAGLGCSKDGEPWPFRAPPPEDRALEGIGAVTPLFDALALVAVERPVDRAEDDAAGGGRS